MCIAIAIKPLARITKSQFMNSWNSNPDGFGMLWVEGETLKSFKELDDKKKAWKVYQDINSCFPESPKVLHFRIGTSGKMDINNCHPFFVNESLAFVHNGILNIKTPEKDFSDTWHFNRILKGIPDCLSDENIQLLEGFCKGSKLVFLDNKGNFTIIGERLGHCNEKNDIWFSNYSYVKQSSFYEKDYSSWGNYWHSKPAKKLSSKVKRLFKPDDDKACIYCGDNTQVGISGICVECASSFDVCYDCGTPLNNGTCYSCGQQIEVKK